MPSAVIDSFATAASWSAQDQVGAPSAAIALTAVADVHAPVGDQSSLRVVATPASAGHRIERSFGTLDLSSFSELRWWVRSDRAADGSRSAPFRLRVELGSTGSMPVGAPGNLWHRLVPIGRANAWEYVRVSLDDLDPNVATTADTIRFTIVDHTASGVEHSVTAWLDELIACEPRMVADVTDALVELLDAQLVLPAPAPPTPVPAEFVASGSAVPASPCIRIALSDVAFSDRRTVVGDAKTNFVDTGYRLTRESVAYDLRYRIDAFTSDPIHHLAIVDFVVTALGHRRTLPVGGTELALDRMAATERDQWDDPPVLRYVVAARTDATGSTTFVPVAELDLVTDVARP